MHILLPPEKDKNSHKKESIKSNKPENNSRCSEEYSPKSPSAREPDL
jgi:hypothetical protein